MLFAVQYAVFCPAISRLLREWICPFTLVKAIRNILVPYFCKNY